MGERTLDESVRSVQEVRLAVDGERLDLSSAERLPDAYWRFLRRLSLGLIRVIDADRAPAIVLLARPLVLLRFGEGRSETGAAGAGVTLPIEGGLLLARSASGRGFLRFEFARTGSDRVVTGLVARAVVEGYRPRICAPGPLLGVRSWVYSQTQLRLHQMVMRRFLRSLGPSEPSPASRAGD